MCVCVRVCVCVCSQTSLSAEFCNSLISKLILLLKNNFPNKYMFEVWQSDNSNLNLIIIITI